MNPLIEKMGKKIPTEKIPIIKGSYGSGKSFFGLLISKWLTEKKIKHKIFTPSDSGLDVNNFKIQLRKRMGINSDLVEFLEKKKYCILIDEFQRVSKNKEIVDFITHLRRKLSIVIVCMASDPRINFEGSPFIPVPFVVEPFSLDDLNYLCNEYYKDYNVNIPKELINMIYCSTKGNKGLCGRMLSTFQTIYENEVSNQEKCQSQSDNPSNPWDNFVNVNVPKLSKLIIDSRMYTAINSILESNEKLRKFLLENISILHEEEITESDIKGDLLKECLRNGILNYKIVGSQEITEMKQFMNKEYFKRIISCPCQLIRVSVKKLCHFYERKSKRKEWLFGFDENDLSKTIVNCLPYLSRNRMKSIKNLKKDGEIGEYFIQNEFYSIFSNYMKEEKDFEFIPIPEYSLNKVKTGSKERIDLVVQKYYNSDLQKSYIFEYVCGTKFFGDENSVEQHFKRNHEDYFDHVKFEQLTINFY